MGTGRLACALLPFGLLVPRGPAAVQAAPTHELKWGSVGTGPGQFETPYGFGLGPDGHVYVADTGNNRIQEFTADGVFVRAIGHFGHLPGEFDFPTDVAIDPGGRIYVADHGNVRIQVFDAGGAFVDSFTTELGFPPTALAIDYSGQNVFALLSSGYMLRYDAQGHHLNYWIVRPGSTTPWGFGVHANDDITLAEDGGGCEIRTFSPTGALLSRWSAPVGLGAGQCSGSGFEAVAIVNDSTLHVADLSGYIQTFSSTGTFINRWGSPGNGDGQFSYVTDIASAADGSIYVLDTGLCRVQKFGQGLTPTLRQSWGSLKLLYR